MTPAVVIPVSILAIAASGSAFVSVSVSPVNGERT